MSIKLVAPPEEYGNFPVAMKLARLLLERGVSKTEVTAWRDIVKVVVNGSIQSATIIPMPHVAIGHVVSGSFVDVGLSILSTRMLSTTPRKSTISNWGTGVTIPPFQLLTEERIRTIRGSYPNPAPFSVKLDDGLTYRSISSSTLYTVNCGKVGYKTESLDVTKLDETYNPQFSTPATGTYSSTQMNIAHEGINTYAGGGWTNPSEVDEAAPILTVRRNHRDTQTDSETYDGNGDLTTTSTGSSSTAEYISQVRSGLSFVSTLSASGVFEYVLVLSGGGSTYSYSTSTDTTQLTLDGLVSLNSSYTTTTITQLPGPTTTTAASGESVSNIGTFRNSMVSYSTLQGMNPQGILTTQFKWQDITYKYIDTMSTMYNAAAIYSASVLNGADTVIVDEPESIPVTGGSTTFGRVETVDMTLSGVGEVAPLGDFNVSFNRVADHIIPYRVQLNQVNTVEAKEIVFDPTITEGKLVDNKVVSIADTTVFGDVVVFIGVGGSAALPVICSATNKIKLFSSILDTYDTQKDGDSPSEQEQFALNVFKILYNVSSDIRQVMGVAFY